MRQTLASLSGVILLLLLLTSGLCVAQEAPEPGAEPVTDEVTEQRDGPVRVAFPGGTVRDLASYMQELTGDAYAVMGAVDRSVQPLEMVLPNTSLLGEAVGAAARVSQRPGWVLVDPGLAEPSQPTNLELADREFEAKRDLVEIGPIKAEGVVLATALEEVSALTVMPILIDCIRQIEPMAVEAEKMPVHEFVRLLAEQTGLEAKPVSILFGLTAENLNEAMKWITDEELAEGFDSRIGMFENLSPEMQNTVTQWMYGEFRKMSDVERAGAVEFAGKFFKTLNARFGAMQGADAEKLTGRLGQMAGFGLDFYRSLPPGDRAELQPLAEIFLEIRGR